MAAAREITVAVLDVGSGMSPKQLDLASRSVELYAQQKLFFTKRDEVGVIILGSDETENDLYDPNDAEDDPYAHLSVMSDITTPTPELLNSIRTVATSGASSNCTNHI